MLSGFNLKRFSLDRDRVDWTPYAVYWLQSIWALGMGVIFALTPRRRLGSSYQFILSVPNGENILAALYFVIGIMLMFSLIKGETKQLLMANALSACGIGTWVFGGLLATGALFGPTGAVGWWFCLYVGAHMLLHSITLRHQAKNTGPQAST